MMNKTILVLLVLTPILLNSCKIKQIGNENSYDDILSAVISYEGMNVVLKKMHLEDGDTINFLNSECMSLEKDSLYYVGLSRKKVLQIKDKDYFLENREENFLYIYQIIENKQLARVDITYKNSTGVLINLERKDDGVWFITSYDVLFGIQLKDTEATTLYDQIRRQKLIKPENN